MSSVSFEPPLVYKYITALSIPPLPSVLSEQREFRAASGDGNDGRGAGAASQTVEDCRRGGEFWAARIPPPSPSTPIPLVVFLMCRASLWQRWRIKRDILLPCVWERVLTLNMVTKYRVKLYCYFDVVIKTVEINCEAVFLYINQWHLPVGKSF